MVTLIRESEGGGRLWSVCQEEGWTREVRDVRRMKGWEVRKKWNIGLEECALWVFLGLDWLQSKRAEAAVGGSEEGREGITQ